MNPLIIKDCQTTHGGIVVEVDSSFVIEGIGVHLEGMTHFCPKCKTVVSAISSGKGFMVVGSRTIIMAGDKTSCGATFIAKQTRVVRANGTGSGGGGTAKSSFPSSFPSMNQDNTIMGFSKVPQQTLTEDDKILTSAECRLIVFRLSYVSHRKTKHGKNVMAMPEIPKEIRQQITEIYFQMETMEEGMGAVETLFDSVTGLLGKTAGMVEIVETLVGDQVKLLADNKLQQLWNNDSRNRYFKVGSAENPVDKFINSNFHLINTVYGKNKVTLMDFEPYKL